MGLATLLLIGLALTWAICIAGTIVVLTRPPRRTYASAVAKGRPGEPSELDTPLEFTEWKLEPEGCPVWDITGLDPSGPVVVMTHGWADSRVGALVRIPAFAGLASRIIAWDLPGHGEAPGACRLGTQEPELLKRLLDRVVQGDGARPLLFLYGWSLGAGVSIAAATDPAFAGRIAGIIAEAPYRLPKTPARRVLHLKRLPVKPVVPPAFALLGLRFGVGPGWRAFDRAEFARALSCPLLVLHGAEDEVCPIEDGREIAKAAPAGKLLEITGGNHNTLWTDPETGPRCAEGVRAFLERVASGDL